MLPSTERLRREEFTRVTRGKVMHTPYFSVRSTPTIGEGSKSKAFSVVVSKKVAKTAVARNSIRRRMYAILSDNSFQHMHAIFYMKIDALAVPTVTLKEHVKKALLTT